LESHESSKIFRSRRNNRGKVLGCGRRDRKKGRQGRTGKSRRSRLSPKSWTGGIIAQSKKKWNRLKGRRKKAASGKSGISNAREGDKNASKEKKKERGKVSPGGRVVTRELEKGRQRKTGYRGGIIKGEEGVVNGEKWVN